MTPNINMLKRIENQTFVGANVQLDGGTTYVKCKFVKCNMVYLGVGPVQLDGNIFDECGWQFTGPAGNTLNFLKLLYAGGGKEMVEGLFREIRGDRSPLIMNPASKAGGKVQ